MSLKRTREKVFNVTFNEIKKRRAKSQRGKRDKNYLRTYKSRAKAVFDHTMLSSLQFIQFVSKVLKNKKGF